MGTNGRKKNEEYISAPTLLHRSSVMHGDLLMERSAVVKNLQEPMRPKLSHQQVEFEKKYINAWCRTHELLKPSCPSISGYSFKVFMKLVIEYLWAMLGLGGFESEQRLHLWYHYLNAGFTPEQLVGSVDPILFADRYSSHWLLGDRPWTEDEKLMGRKEELIFDDSESSIYSISARDLPTALPPGQRSHARLQEPQDRRQHLSSSAATLQESSEDYDSASDSSVHERQNTRARHREHTEQRDRNPTRPNRLDKSLSHHRDRHSSSSQNNVTSSSGEDWQDVNTTLAHANDHVARSGRDISRPVQLSDQQLPSPSGQAQSRPPSSDLQLFEQFVRTHNLDADRSAELRRHLMNNVSTLETTASHSDRHSSAAPTRGSDFNQNNAVNDQSTLGNMSSIATTPSNPLIVMQGFTHRTKTTCQDFPKTTFPSVMQQWRQAYIHYRDSLPYGEAVHSFRFIKKAASYHFMLMWQNSLVLPWNLKPWDKCIEYESLVFIDLLIRVAAQVYGDDRVTYTSRCDIHCRSDGKGQPDVDRYINEMGEFFDANTLDEVTRVDLIVKGFAENFDAFHNVLTSKLSIARMDRQRISIELVHEWIAELVRNSRNGNRLNSRQPKDTNRAHDDRRGRERQRGHDVAERERKRQYQPRPYGHYGPSTAPPAPAGQTSKIQCHVCGEIGHKHRD
jgi:hypothetical protein